MSKLNTKVQNEQDGLVKYELSYVQVNLNSHPLMLQGWRKGLCLILECFTTRDLVKMVELTEEQKYRIKASIPPPFSSLASQANIESGKFRIFSTRQSLRHKRNLRIIFCSLYHRYRQTLTHASIHTLHMYFGSQKTNMWTEEIKQEFSRLNTFLGTSFLPKFCSSEWDRILREDSRNM
jgi:hypothetical protein